MNEAPIRCEKVSHWFGRGDLRQQVLHDVTTTIRTGEIVVLTGPSGSGKTTLLTLIGALRSTQAGSLQVLGRELRDASEQARTEVRKSIGYIFQAHNLLDALSVRQNVEMALQLHGGVSTAEREERSRAMLASVGLGDLVDRLPTQVSGGQRQRVAIARALVGEPRILLADEPTASLDRETGREIVNLMQRLARERGVTVLLVTHDHRILDIADRVLALEDGRLSSFMAAATSQTHQLLASLARDIRQGELVRRIAGISEEELTRVISGLTDEVQQFLDVLDLSQSTTFHSMLEQVLAAVTSKVAQVIGAERAALYLTDEGHRELWARVAAAGDAGGLVERAPVEARSAACGSACCAGHAAATGETVNIADAQQDPHFDPSADVHRGYATESLLCVPVRDAAGHAFAVFELVNKRDGSFSEADEQMVREFASRLGVLLEGWWRMSCGCPPLPEPARAAQIRPG